MVMKRFAFAKNSRREIHRTLGRYLAILTIIALGVGFFAGLRVTRTDMVKTGDMYLQDTNMFDFRLISTLGLTSDDIESFKELEGITGAQGAISKDFLTDSSNGTEIVLKAMSIGDINTPALSYGRMPETSNECLGDSKAFTPDDIGTVVTISDENDNATKDIFAYSQYTLVGLCTSPLYLNHERGTTSLHGGSITGFVCLPEEGFTSEVYTEAYLTIEKTGEIFSDKYKSELDTVRAEVEGALENRADIRYEDIVQTAEEKLQEAETEYDEGYQEYLSERADAEGQLADAKAELDTALNTLNSSKDKLISGEAELETGEKAYAQGLAEYETNAAAFEEKKTKINGELEETQKQITEGKAAALAGIHQIEDTGVVDNYNQLCQTATELEAQLALLPEDSEEYGEVSAQLELVRQQITAIEETGVINQFNSLTKTVENLDNAQLELDDAKVQAQAQLAAGQAALDDGRDRLATSRAQLDQAKRTLSSGWTEYENGLEEYNGGVSEYESASAEAEKSFAEAEAELNDAGKKLENAKKEINDIEKPDTYTLDRETNTGYVCYDNDSAIVYGVAKVFPLFFFLVAVLVCITTMNRMVDDQRTQIGTLKALGYSNARVIWKYVSYAGSAALIGCIAGFLLGSWLFPKAIWKAYELLYNFGELSLVFDWKLALVSLGVSLACSAGATFISCRKDLSESPAELMRPRAPAIGKRILLEKIPVFWKRLSFLHKVTARNIFRYKKRLFMMVLGISGCTALVITGLGLRDSIVNVADDQFENIMGYDYEISFSNGLSDEEIDKFKGDTKDIISSCVFICGDTAEIDCDGKAKSVNIIATSDDAITDIIDLHINKEPVDYPETGTVALSRQIAKNAGVEVGDKVTLQLDNMETVDVPVSGIFENYVFNYVLMTGETYSDITGRETAYNMAYAVYSGNDIHGDATRIVNDNGANAVTVSEDFRERISTMMNSMNYIVLLIIACAAALAFIVLFNLSNINITERQREIATIKVLGFYPKEAGQYVFRENLVLSAIGAAVGIVFGTVLHRFVMSQINIDMVSFSARISILSYAIGVAVTFLFTYIVDLIMRKKLNRINMAEALKSME